MGPGNMIHIYFSLIWIRDLGQMIRAEGLLEQEITRITIVPQDLLNGCMAERFPTAGFDSTGIQFLENGCAPFPG